MVGLELEIARMYTAVRRVRMTTEEFEGPLGRTTDGIYAQLKGARELLREFQQRTWLVRHISAGAVYENLLSRISEASEALLLVDEVDSVWAQIPAIRAAVKTYLGADDPRFDSYIQFMDHLVRADTEKDAATE